MTQYLNPSLGPRVTAFASGQLLLDKQVTTIGDARAWPSAPANGDQIQIGVVPAGHVLVPQLSQLLVPRLDTNAAATGKYKIGTATTVDAIAAEVSAGTAQSLRGNSLVIGGPVIGDPEVDTPIFLSLSAALATAATSGQVVAELVFRAWDTAVDGSGSDD